MERAGQPIPGSKYVRAFCPGCGEPMRVSAAVFRSGVYGECSTCSPPEPSEATMRAAAKYGRCSSGESGSWHNAVRSMEDCG
jgi:predicted amidophosphoribosyltransferase